MPTRHRHRGVPSTAAITVILAYAAAVLLSSGLAGCASLQKKPAAGVRRAGGAKRFPTRGPTVPHRIEPDAGFRTGGDYLDASSTYLLLRLAERRLYLVRYDDRSETPFTEMESFPVAIGRKGYETPTGVFAITDKKEDPDFVRFDWNDPSRVFGRIPAGPDNPLGRRWIGFASGPGWQIGFHGTPRPELLGQAVSHGCVRMRNEDVVRVYDQVRVGTVVIVQP